MIARPGSQAVRLACHAILVMVRLLGMSVPYRVPPGSNAGQLSHPDDQWLQEVVCVGPQNRNSCCPLQGGSRIRCAGSQIGAQDHGIDQRSGASGVVERPWCGLPEITESLVEPGNRNVIIVQLCEEKRFRIHSVDSALRRLNGPPSL